MLFHQAGSNAAEYSPIVPKLVALGFDTLAVDSRSGGRMFDRNNRTVMALGRAQPFDAAYADLEAALTWSRQAGYPGAVAWGSSYTAALVFRLAAEHDTPVLLLTYPVARWQVVMGKFFGHMMILLAAVVVGYGGAAVITVLFTQNGIDGWQAYVSMMGSSLLLGAVFIALGYLVSVLVRERSTAAGAAR